MAEQESLEEDSVVISSGHHDECRVAGNAKFCEKARAMWGAYRASFLPAMSEYRSLSQQLKTVCFSAVAHKISGTRLTVCLTNVAVFVCKGGEAAAIRYMVPYDAIHAVELGRFCINDEHDVANARYCYKVSVEVDPAVVPKWVPASVRFIVAEREKLLLMHTLERQYEFATARLLCVEEVSSDPLLDVTQTESMHHHALLSTNMRKCKFLLWMVLEDTQRLVDVLCAESVARRPRDIRITRFVARGLLTVASRSGAVERFLQCCVRWEVYRAKHSRLVAEAAAHPLDKASGGFLRTESVAAHAILEYMEESRTARKYLWNTFGSKMKALFSSVQTRLFDHVEVEKWSTRLLRSLVDSDVTKDFPQEVRLVCHLIESLGVPSSAYFMADVVVAHFVCRGIQDPLRFGALTRVPRMMEQRNLRRITRFIEAIGNRCNRVRACEAYFAAPRSVDSDEDAIQLVLTSTHLAAVVPVLERDLDAFLRRVMEGDPSMHTIQLRLVASGSHDARSCPNPLERVEAMDTAAHDTHQLLALHEALGDHVAELLCMTHDSVPSCWDSACADVDLASPNSVTLSLFRAKPSSDWPSALDRLCISSNAGACRCPRRNTTLDDESETDCLRKQCAALQSQLEMLERAFAAQRQREARAISTLTEYHTAITQKDADIAGLRRELEMKERGEELSLLLGIPPNDSPLADSSRPTGTASANATFLSDYR